jgi:tetratricopeptide (TPR) repeat protein
MSRCHALVIGNAEYTDSASFEPLKYAVSDAEEIFQLLIDSPTAIFDKATSVCHRNLDWEAMLHALSAFFAPVQPSDLVLIYFAGHGEPLGNKRLALIMRNTVKHDLAGTAFNVERFVDYFEDKKLQRYIVILDCCRAGKALKSPGVINRGDANVVDLSDLSGRGKIFVTTAGEHQLARELDALQHGLFGYYFIQGIKTGDALEAGDALKSVIDIDDICKHVQKKISKLHPEMYQEVDKSGENILGELPVARNPKYHDTSSPKIDITGLPETDARLFGRNRELETLDTVWNNPDTNIVALVAWGGVGKTALVNQWLSLMQRDKYRGAQRVYGMSFYSQGAAEGKQASADRFFADALRWFDDLHPDQGDPVDKAKRLAALIRQQKTLLILDGLEPLQYPPGADEGRLKDQGVKVLLKALATENPGLCIISTRLWTEDLKTWEGGAVQRLDLTHLAPADGASLLRSLGVYGTEKELRQASADFDGHALALTLLGTYLHAVFDGDVRQRDKIPQLMDAEERQGKHARRVMASYEKWMEQSERGRRQLSILRMLGLFDRPAEPGAIRALLAEPDIKGLTEELRHLAHDKWQFAVNGLREMRLINSPPGRPAVSFSGKAYHGEESSTKPSRDPGEIASQSLAMTTQRGGGSAAEGGELGCHPLIREYFGEKLREEDPDAWQEAHRRLYEYYKNLPKTKYPDTLEAMEPLFAAVAHGCQAGKHQEALDDVYYSRIQRDGATNYCCKKLGAFGADLAAVANFFEALWTQPVAGLTDEAKAYALNWAGFRLRAVGRLREAAQPMQASLEASIKQENWEWASINAGNLSELWLTIGDVPQAVEYARQSVDFADRSGDGFQRKSKRTTLADALRQAGERAEAESLFQAAETIQKEHQPENNYLYSLWGFRYCDLLLSQGKYREVMERAEKALEIAKQYNDLLSIALDKLSLGEAYLLQALEQGTLDFTQAAIYLHHAVEGLRKAGVYDFLTRGLLARVALYRVKQDFPNAWTDLDEVFEIADRSGMKLHLTDYHLEACRLCLAEGKKDAAKKHLDAARALIQATGYHRRDADVQEMDTLLFRE